MRLVHPPPQTYQLVVDRVYDVLPHKRTGCKGRRIGDGGQAEAAGHNVDDLVGKKKKQVSFRLLRPRGLMAGARATRRRCPSHTLTSAIDGDNNMSMARWRVECVEMGAREA